MPSRWTTSGINWDDIRSNRTETVVRELYLAVNERDYFTNVFSGFDITNLDGYVPPSYLNIDERTKRIEDQVDYIYSTLNRWFTPSADIESLDLPQFSMNGSNVSALCGVSCFFDYNSTPIYDDIIDEALGLSTLMWIGWNNIDFTEEGWLEQTTGDLSFLRDYKINRGKNRINIDDLKTVYNILQLKLKSPCFMNFFGRYSNGLPLFLKVLPSSDNGVFPMSGTNSVDVKSINGAIDEFKEYDFSAFAQPPYVVNKSRYIDNFECFHNESTNATRIRQKTSYLSLGINNKNGDVFDASSFDVISLGLGVCESFTGDEDIYLDNGYDNVVFTRECPHEIVFDQSGSSYSVKLISVGNASDFSNFVDTGVDIQSRGSFETLPFIDFNIENFLEYYTEPSN